VTDPRPLECDPHDDGLIFAVHVRPRASRSKIVGLHDGALAVQLAAPPVDGAANQELTKVLARALRVPRSAVRLVSGQRSRRKRVHVAGVARATLDALLAGRP